MRLFQAPLDTCLDSPLLASLSVHGWHFTVYAPSRIISERFSEELSETKKATFSGQLRSAEAQYHARPYIETSSLGPPPPKMHVIECHTCERKLKHFRNAAF